MSTRHIAGLGETECEVLGSCDGAELLRLIPSGCHVVRAQDGSVSVDLHYSEVQEMLADDTLIANCEVQS